MPDLAAAAGLCRRLCAEAGSKKSDANRVVRLINKPGINHTRLRRFAVIVPEDLISRRVKDVVTCTQVKAGSNARQAQ